MIRIVDDAPDGTEVFVNQAGSVSIRRWFRGYPDVVAVEPDDIPSLIKELRHARREAKLIKTEEPARN